MRAYRVNVSVVTGATRALTILTDFEGMSYSLLMGGGWLMRDADGVVP